MFLLPNTLTCLEFLNSHSEQSKCLGEEQCVVLNNRSYVKINIKESDITRVQRIKYQIIKTWRKSKASQQQFTEGNRGMVDNCSFIARAHVPWRGPVFNQVDRGCTFHYMSVVYNI